MVTSESGSPELFRNPRTDPNELYIAVQTPEGLLSPDEDVPDLFVRPLGLYEHLSQEALANGYIMGHVTYDITTGSRLKPHEAYPNALGQAIKLNGAMRAGSSFRIFDAHAIDEQVDALSAYRKSAENGSDEALIRSLRLKTHFLHQASNLIRFGRLQSPSEVRHTPEA